MKPRSTDRAETDAKGRSKGLLGCLGCAGLIGVAAVVLVAALLFWGWSMHKEQQSRLAAVGQRLAGKRASAVIEQTVACDLVEEQLLKRLYENRTLRELTCEGPYSADAQHGTLQGIEASFTGAERVPLTGCLAHANRWFVIQVVRSGDCPAGPWTVSPATTESELEAHEDTLREKLRRQGEAERLEAFLARLDAVRALAQSDARTERTCPVLDLSQVTRPSGTRAQIPTVDLDVLSANRLDPQGAEGEWGFLTSGSMWSVLDPSATTDVRATALHDMEQHAGPYLLVYRSRERRSPVVNVTKGMISDDISFVSGRFEGWMIVVDTRDAQVACEAPLSARNSSTVKYKSRGVLSTAEGRANEAVAEDFRRQFEEAAIADIKRISDDQFRLGYKWLE
jgi:hypothetical protein